MTWVDTNYRERHLKREGRILGKIQRGPGETKWAAIINGRPRISLGSRVRESNAKRLVESHWRTK